MTKLTASQALLRLPHKEYLSLREVWKDLKLFNTVLSATKIKALPDAFDAMDLAELKKAKINKPKNERTLPTRQLQNKKSPSLKNAPPAPAPTKKSAKAPADLPVKAPGKDKQVFDIQDLAPTFTGPTQDVTDKFNPDTRFKPIDSIKLSPTDKAGFSDSNKQLAIFMHQREIIANILNSLKGGFANISDESADNIAKAIKYSEGIQKVIEGHIAALRGTLHKSTIALLPDSFNNLVRNVYNDLKLKINISTKHKIDLMYTAGIGSPEDEDAQDVQGSPSFQLTGFLILHNIETANGTVPLYVIAISLINNQYFINPTLQRVPTIGKFNVGIKISRSKDGTPDLKAAKRAVEEQFNFIGNMAAVRNVPVPPHLEGMELRNIQSVDSVNFGPKAITVVFKKAIVSGGQASTASNNIYVILKNSLYIFDPHNKIQITQKVGQNETNQWFALYRFSKLDSMSGRTLHRDEVDYLSKIFTQDDVKKIRFILSSEKTSQPLKQKRVA